MISLRLEIAFIQPDHLRVVINGQDGLVAFSIEFIFMMIKNTSLIIF
jgi:hypothetical protein